ncbi:adenosylcobinamide-phosphate synthase CbiB [Xylophilus sp. Leaf220]|uniref:adenosylcobinamide-phosphate synthase CbiB n=1 Tax=Xylophilus sp. Leaf220 TaxID=1735686 RepID=UPI0006FFAB96|nr:adenosylcobinamide-phosphate synthase CbiB [Xylophilus sp. Leaf220]KQM80531.1 cobalamin biosynthesis protein CobD [Xylophilus sp. Leaf220]
MAAPLADATLAALAVVIALAVDWRWGEPRVWHPVVGMGRYLGAAGRWLMRRSGADIGGDSEGGGSGDAGAGAQAASSALPNPSGPSAGRWRLFAAGALAWSVGAVAVGLAAALLQWLALHLPPWAAAIAIGLALKPLLAWRMLHDEVAAVEAALAVSLDAGRARLSRLVSRDVTQLTDTEVRESAIETLAENLNDSVVAPLFWFLLLGLPGAAVYRFANTADAMWGYRGRWEWAGKWAARADDLLSWLPARITAALLLALRPALWPRLPAEARRTPSPNGGWPMGAMALRLGVRLSKPGVYCLNAGRRDPRPADTAQALKSSRKAVVAGVLCGLLAIYSIALARMA